MVGGYPRVSQIPFFQDGYHIFPSTRTFMNPTLFKVINHTVIAEATIHWRYIYRTQNGKSSSDMSIGFPSSWKGS
jgi:hypothetical protein